MTTRLTRTLGAVAAGSLMLAACSQDDSDAAYPSGDLTLIVQAAAGGGSDLTSRALAAELEDVLDVSIIVENRPGASGSTAMQYVRDQDADGYTIGFAPVEIAMLGHQNFDVDPADFDFLGQIMLAPGVLAVPNDSPYDTLEEFVAAAQSTSMSVSNSGAGSIWELAALGLAEATNAQISPVPFDGGGPAIAAVIGSQVDAGVGGAGEVSQAAAEGQLKPLVIFHDERHPDLPDVPTAAEAGYDGLLFGGWGGIYAPKDLPDDVHSALSDAISEAAQSDDFAQTVTSSGNLVVSSSASEFTDFVNSEYQRFGSILGTD